MKTYDNILSEVVTLIQDTEKNNLERYWKVGGLVAEFCKGSDRAEYGQKTIQHLAQDMQDQGALSDIKDPTRFLYWAKSINDTYKLPALKDLCNKGLTVYHAKLLLSLTDEDREQVQLDMVDGDKIVSGRKLQEIIRNHVRQDAIAAVEAAVVATESEPVAKPEASKPEPAAPGFVYQSSDDPDVPVEDGGAGGGKPAGKAPAPKSPSEKKSSSSDTISPLKAINQLDKQATKLMGSIPDALIAIKEAGKRGFDSDKAFKNYKAKLADLKGALNSLQDPIAKLVQVIEDENPDG